MDYSASIVNEAVLAYVVALIVVAILYLGKNNE